MAFTKIVGAGIHTLSNITSHNIHSSGIITATKFDGPFDGSTGDFSGNVTIGGNLTVNGTTTTLDTNLIDVDKIEVTTTGTNVAVAVTHNGTGDLVRLYDGASQVVTVDDEGNVGIGSAMPSAKLDIVNGTTSISFTKTNNNPHIDFKANNVTEAGAIKVAESAGGGVLQFFTKTTGGTSTQRMSIDTSGNVGINSTIPTATLDVNGVGIITAGIKINTSPAITIRDGTTEKGYIGFYANDPFIGRKSGVGLLFQDNKVRPVDGDTGIGTNNTVSLGEPTYKFKDLYLEGDIHIDSDVGQLRIGADEDLKIDHNGSNAYFMNGTGSTLYRSDGHTFESGDGGTEYARITSDGYLGINQTSPIHPISIGINTSTAWSANKNISNTTNNDFIGLNIDNSNSGANPEVGIMLQAGASGSGQWTINCRKTAGNQGELVFRTRDGGVASKEVLKIDSGGRTKFMGTRAGSLQPSDTDSVNLYTKSTNNSVDRGSSIAFFNHDNSDFEMGGTIQVAKENATADDTAAYMRFCTRPAGTSSNPVVERLRIKSGGQTIVKGVDDQDNFVVDVANTQFAVHTDGTDGEISLRAQDASGSNNSKYMTFFTHPSGSAAKERLRIKSDGTITLNDNNLELSGPGSADSTAFDDATWEKLVFAPQYSDVARGPNKIVLQNDTGGGGWFSGFGIHTNTLAIYSGGDTVFRQDSRNDNHAGNFRMIIKEDGNVGIGTDDPNNPLTIHASSNHIYLKDTATDNNLQIRSSGGVAEFNSFGTGGVRRAYVFNQYATEVLRIDTSGRVGIGNTMPEGSGLDIKHDRTTAYAKTSDQRDKAQLIIRNGSDAPGRFSSMSFVSGGGTQAEGSINMVQTGNYTGDFRFKLRAGGGSTDWRERFRITSNGIVHQSNETDELTWSRQTGRAQQGDGVSVTYTIKEFYWGIATFKIGLSDGNNKWATFVVEIGGHQYTGGGQAYHAAVVANNTGGGPTITPNQQDGGYHITIANGGNSNTLFGSWVLEGTSYSDGSTPTLVTS